MDEKKEGEGLDGGGAVNNIGMLSGLARWLCPWGSPDRHPIRGFNGLHHSRQRYEKKKKAMKLAHRNRMMNRNKSGG